MRLLLTTLMLLQALMMNTSAQTPAWHFCPVGTSSSRYDDLCFVNSDYGWVIDYSGYLLKTKDSGQTWELIYGPISTDYRSIMFFDSLRGFLGLLFPVPDYFYKTIDGGYTWSIVNLPVAIEGGICGMCKVDDSTACAVGAYWGNPSFYKTTDKGETWTYTDLSDYATGLVDVYFWTPDSGIVVGAYGGELFSDSGGVILSTWDGGASWQVRHKTNTPVSLCWKITFPSAETGYVSLEQLDHQDSVFFFLKTEDKGMTWEQKIYHTGEYYNAQGIGFVNDSVGWIGGDDLSFMTSDGGASWSTNTLYPVIDSGMNRFRKINDSLAFCSGYFIGRYSTDGFFTSVASKTSDHVEINILPNPTDGELKILLRVSSPVSLAFDIYSMNGKLVLHQQANFYSPGDHYINVHPFEIESGTYLVVFNNEQMMISEKMIIR